MHFLKKVLTKQFLFVIITFAEREYLRKRAAMAQLVEHILGKDEVPSSTLGSSSKTTPLLGVVFFVVLELLLSKELSFANGKVRFVPPALRSKGGYLGLRRKTQL